MGFVEVKENKKDYLPLLLLADEQEDMVDRYLDRGRMYVLDDGGVKCECVVTDEGGRRAGNQEYRDRAGVSGKWLREGHDRFYRGEIQGAVRDFAGGNGGQPADHPILREMRFRPLPHGAQFFHGSLRPSHIRGRGFAGGYGVSAEAALNFRQEPCGGPEQSRLVRRGGDNNPMEDVICMRKRL